jgi:hypothetical protein
MYFTSVAHPPAVPPAGFLSKAAQPRAAPGPNAKILPTVFAFPAQWGGLKEVYEFISMD